MAIGCDTHASNALRNVMISVSFVLAILSDIMLSIVMLSFVILSGMVHCKQNCPIWLGQVPGSLQLEI